MEKNIEKIKDDLIEIKNDLKYHIKRTDLLDTEVNMLKEFMIEVHTLLKFFKWLIPVSFGTLSTILVILKIIEHIK